MSRTKPLGILKPLSLAALSLTLSACKISTPPDDPYENFNRAAYGFNQGVDRAILKPVAEVYNDILPWPARTGFRNFFSNLNDVPTTGNDILQGNFKQALNDAWRFAINSTVGIFGVFDVASKIGLPKHKTDLGMTFRIWGFKRSPYTVIPLLGPSTVTNAVGTTVQFNYMSLWRHIYPVRWRNVLLGTWVVSNRADLLGFEEARRAAAFDPYVFDRNAYIQYRDNLYREHLIQRGWTERLKREGLDQDQDPLGDDPFVEEAPTQPPLKHDAENKKRLGPPLKPEHISKQQDTAANREGTIKAHVELPPVKVARVAPQQLDDEDVA